MSQQRKKQPQGSHHRAEMAEDERELNPRFIIHDESASSTQVPEYEHAMRTDLYPVEELPDEEEIEKVASRYTEGPPEPLGETSPIKEAKYEHRSIPERSLRR
ncbi:hypothetical protein P9112_002090 [Eukaryota sp. TZLM1-RC]